MKNKKQNILERLQNAVVIGAEGYVFELEKRGYIKAGPYVPEVVLDFPDALRELSKEFVRRWLIQNGFQGLEGQQIPEMSDEYIETVSDRYIELYENILGEKFVKADISNINERIEKNVLAYLANK